MLEKCKDYKSKTLLIVNETYTTPTCGNCRYVKKNINCNKIFKCDKCKITLSRDINGSHNILLHLLQ